jgi:tetratricopeptide (TPR) repeat protein
MHRGVQELIAWIDGHAETIGDSAGGAPGTAVAAIEQAIASPLPSDLGTLLMRLDGGRLPDGLLLRARGQDERSILGALSLVASSKHRRADDPELLLPFYRTDEGSYHAFDRSAGPVADTWPIVDYQLDEGEQHLVHRTFDGWCRLRVAEWTASDFGREFTVDSYLASGRRHAAIEPDVSVAHATVAHALRRAGEPEKALASYLRAARCTPPLAWCDWEALKLAALLGKPEEAIEAARRLCAPAPQSRWAERETTPVAVADALGRVAEGMERQDVTLRLLDQLAAAASDEDAGQVTEVRRSLYRGEDKRPTVPPSPTSVEPSADPEQLWNDLARAYREGRVRDQDLLLDPSYQSAADHKPLAEILRIRRDF